MNSSSRTSSAIRTQPTRLRYVLLAGLLTGAMVLAACGGDDASGDTTTTRETSTTPPGEMTTVTQSEVTTTASMPATTTTETQDTNSLAAGSGCTPGSSGSLPDGEWFGYFDGVSADEIQFDLACWFTGDAAALAAAEDGEESPPPNDFYVRNVNPTIRAIPVAGDATVTWLPNPGDPATEEKVPYSDWTTQRGTRDYQPGAWLTIKDGRVVEIQEQYVP